MDTLNVGMVGFDITPSIHPVCGAWGCNPTITAVDQPLAGRCLALQQGDRQVVWLSFDLVGDSPRFTLTTATDGESVDLTQVITYIRYSGAFQKVIADTASEFSITPLGKSNGDYILDEDETFEITMLNLETTLSNPLVVRRSFEMEIITRDGAVLHLARTMTIRLNVWISLPF